MTARFDGWRELSFGELVAHSAFGPRFGGDDYDDEGNVATLRTTDLEDDGRIDYATMPRARLEEAHFQQHFLQPGDLVITRSGTCGIAAVFCGFHLPVLPGAFLVRFRLTEDADPRFIAHYFNSSSGRQHILSVAKGAVQQNLNITNVEALRLQVPSIGTQRSIASSLGAYDDLIDNNRRRIKLLEDSVRLLFDEWFVRARLPTHLGAGHGDQPRHLSLDAICEDVKVPVLPETLDPATPYVGFEHMPRRSITLNDWGAVTDVSSTKLCYKEGEVVFGKIRPYFHKVGVALTDGVCSSDAIVMRPKAPQWKSLLVALVSSDAFIASTAQGMKEGSKMPRADWKQMKAYEITVPSQRVLEAFNAVVEPILEQCKTLALQSRSLRTARDLLLPRLMSGELTV